MSSGVQLAATHHVLPQRFIQWLQQFAGCAYPIGECRTFQFDAFTCINLGLAIQRKMMGVFGNQNMRQQACPC